MNRYKAISRLALFPLALAILIGSGTFGFSFAQDRWKLVFYNGPTGGTAGTLDNIDAGDADGAGYDLQDGDFAEGRDSSNNAYLYRFVIISTWQASTAYSLEDRVVPTSTNGYWYECTTAGTSGASEPTWGTTLGGTTNDGTVVWTCRDESSPYYIEPDKYNGGAYTGPGRWFLSKLIVDAIEDVDILDGTANTLAIWNDDGRLASNTPLGDLNAGGEVSNDSHNHTVISLPSYASDTVSFSNKTLDANDTGNVVKGYGFITLKRPDQRGAGMAAVTTTDTDINYGMPTFANGTDEATNWMQWFIEVPRDLDTAVDLVAWFKFRLGGADTNDHDYVISMVSIADSAAQAGTPANPINLSYAADGSGASGDIETAGGDTLTAWRTNMTAGQLWMVRVARDGDSANDSSTVDSYPVELTLRYGWTQ